MPSPRSSPALRPSSPLSPNFKSPAPAFDNMHLQPPSRGLHHSRPSSSSSRRRAPPQLPGLPRFHPANYMSQNSSTSSTPGSQFSSPDGANGPLSPRRLYSEAQQQLYNSQRDAILAARSGPSSTSWPSGPKLAPLGSPGPVTPLALEASAGYMVAGVRSFNSERDEEVVDRLICQEARRSAARAESQK